MANEARITVTSRDKSGPGFRSARQRADDLGKSTRRVGEIASGILAAGIFERLATSAVRAFAATIDAASNLEQAVGGTEAVFGDAGDLIDAFGQRSADAVGLSERAFREATTLIGGQLKRMTGDVDFAAEQSIRLTQVAADLAATYGGTTTQAVEALGSAFRGEADPAERFNLNLKIGEVNAKAVELGLAATTSEVDENARAQATLALIMEQSADAQGQFARESDSTAGAQQRMKAAVEDTQASIGQALLPVMSTLSDFLTLVLDGFQALPGPVQAASVIIGGMAVTAGAAAGALRALGFSAELLKKSLPFIGGALAIGGAIIGGLAALGSQSESTAEDVEVLADAIRNADLAGIARDLEDRGVLEKVQQLGLSTEEVVAAFAAGGPAMDDFRSRLEEIAKEKETVEKHASGLNTTIKFTAEAFTEDARTAQELLDILIDLEAGLIDTEEAERRIANATGDADEALRSHEESVRAAEEAYDDAKSALDDYLDEIASAVDPLSSYQEQQERVAEAQDRVNKLEEEGKTDSEEYTQAVTALWQEQQKLDAVTLDAGTSVDQMRRELRKARAEGKLDEEQYRNQMAALDDLEEQAEDTAGRYDVETHLQGVRRAEIELNHLTEARFVPIIAQAHTATAARGLAQMTAHGGIAGARGMQGGGATGSRSRLVVGEHRPEVVEVPPGSRVIPSVDQATDRNQLAPGGGGVTVNLFVQGSIRSDRDLIEIIRDEFLNGGFRGALEGATA